MIEIRITKEIGDYDPKFVGPFSLRQTVCLVVGGIVCYYIYNVISPILTKDIAGFFCMIPAGIALLVGWVKPYGMRTEAFVQSIFTNIVLAPTNRKYKTVNQIERLLSIAELRENSELSAKQRKKQKQPKPKYKRDQSAIK